MRFPVPSTRRLFTVLSLTLASVTLGIFAGCKKAPPPAPAAQPTPVSVITIEPRSVTLTQELPGRTSAFRVAEVRARVSGIVLERRFTEGADVKEGDVLFRIDPAPYEAALDSAKGQLARAKASQSSAEAQAGRFEGLVKTNAVSRQDYDNALAQRDSFAADVAAAEAAVRAAEINLGYTEVVAPITGRIGRAAVTEGAYVQQGTATLLAVVQQLDPLYVDLSRPAAEVMRLKQSLESGRLQRAGDGQARLSLLLEDGSPYSEEGTLQFSDVSVDPGTGSVTLRGLFPNPKADLLPGLFVRARLTEATVPDALLVPQSAVTRNTRGDATTLIVGADQKAELRTIKTSRTIGDQWLVTDGLKPGDRVIIDHLHVLRPGAPVAPTAAQPAPTAQASASTSAK